MTEDYIDKLEKILWTVPIKSKNPNSALSQYKSFRATDETIPSSRHSES